MSLAEACRDSFSQPIRHRGNAYFLGGRARIKRVTDTDLTAEVRGSGRRLYTVEIDTSEADAGGISATCSCPHYERGALCKHIWAVLLQADRDGTTRKLLGAESDPWEPDDDGPWDAETDQFDEELDDEVDDAEESLVARLVRNPWQTNRQSYGPRRDGRAKPDAGWQAHLDDIASHAWHSLERTAGSSRRTRGVEAWFVLNVGECLAGGKLIIDLGQRERQRDGEFGKIKRLDVRPGQIPSLGDPVDSELVELLVGNQAAELIQKPYYAYREFQRSVSRVAVAPALYDTVLPRLAATGRFVWQLDSSLPVEEARPIQWDDGEPWHFRLRVEEDEARQLWRFSGWLDRGEHAVSIHDAVLLMATGLVLFPERLARFEVPEADFGWIVSLRGGAALEVPFGKRDQLLETLYELPQLPDTDWPEALRVEHHREPVQARLELQSPQEDAYRPPGQLSAKVSFLYGERAFSWDDPASGGFHPEQNRVLVRDREREAELLDQLAGTAVTWNQLDDGLAREAHVFLHQQQLPEVVRQLNSLGWIVESQGVRLRRPGSFQLSVSTEVDWFELNGQNVF